MNFMNAVVVIVFELVRTSCQDDIFFETEEMEVCKASKDKKDCVQIDLCPKALEDLRLGIFPKPCAFQGTKPFVCCNKLDLHQPGLKSQRECDKMYNKLSLDEYDDFAFDSHETLTEDFPHAAALGTKLGTQMVWICVGTLISEKFVLTAAHCLDDPKGRIDTVRLGDLDLNSNSDGVQPQDFKVSSRISHPDYIPYVVYHDLALIELDRAVEISNFVKPACLHTSREIEELGMELVGFHSSNSSEHLYALPVTENSRQLCDYYFELDSFLPALPKGVDHEMQICATGVLLDSPCQMDSGGPLQYARRNHVQGRHVLGVTAIMEPCSTTSAPGLFTRVSYYLPWIESHVWPDN